MIKTFLCLGALIISYCSFSQVDFTGSWALISKQHISGPKYGNALPTKMKITQAKDSLIFESTNMGADGKETTSRLSIAMNGMQSVSTSAVSKRKYTRWLAWSEDKKTLILTTIFSMPEKENETDFTRVESWSLSADGKELIINKKSIETRFETWEVKGVFERSE